jgi:hypothetical protein
MTRAALLSACTALWLATAAGAALALVGLRLASAGAPRDALAANPGTALALLAHNAPIALWPLALAALGWNALAGARSAGDVLIAAQLASHGLTVGSALRQHPDTWRYLPHLPLEWLGVAIPVAVWWSARNTARPPHTRGDLALAATSCLAALTAAAAIETYLVPVA